MNIPDMPVNVPIDDPDADTEWNDILRKHGVIPEKPPSPTPMIEEAVQEAIRLAHEKRLEGKDLDELDELEDEEDEEFLAAYRNKRLAELSTLSQKSVHGRVYPLQKPDYAREVTAASKEYPLLVHLSSASHGNVESRLLSELWRRAAEKFPDVKFCEIRGDMCIEGYPDKNCPTILVYKDECIVKQIIRLGALRGMDTRLEDIEGLMVEVGAIKGTDQRLRKRDEEEERKSGIRSVGKQATVDDDDDWD
ncbi:Proteolipid protein 2 [Rhizina undulata]